MIHTFNPMVPDIYNLKVQESIDLIFNYTTDSAVSFSGGKDSLVILDMAFYCGIRRFVYCDTTIDLPDMPDYLNELEKYYGIKIDHVKAPQDFFDIVDSIGIPSRRLRWCCEVFKFAPLANYISTQKLKYLLTGLRSEESIKRNNYTSIGKNPLIPVVQINPILDFTEEDVWHYINSQNLLVNANYKKGFRRLGCWPCPFKTKFEWDILNRNYPHLVEKLNTVLQQNLTNFGGVGVRDKVSYIQSLAWTKNAIPQRNKYIGEIKLHEINKRDEMQNYRYEISVNNHSDFQSLILNIDLIKKNSNKFEIDENRNNIIFETAIEPNKILIFAEKQINCVGCGACQSLCPFFALYVEGKSYRIDFTKCHNCFLCLSTTSMRGGCIARNYRPIRRQFKTYNFKQDFAGILSLFSPCGRNQIGIIRTRKPIQKLVDQIKTFVEEEYQEVPKVTEQKNIGEKKFSEKYHSYSIFCTKFSSLARENRGYSEIEIKIPNEDNIETILNQFISKFKTIH